MLRTSRELQHTFQRLLDTKQALTGRILQNLSDLNREESAQFQEIWNKMPAERRRQLARALAELAEEDFQVDYHAIFRWLLNDSDPQVRALAIDGLWEDEDTALIGPLARLLTGDPDVGVRAAAATSLGRYVLLGELEEIASSLAMHAEQVLLATIHSANEDVEVRRRAIESIAYSGEAGVRDIIENAYYDEDERMRVSALFAMGRSADTYWRDTVLLELNSERPAIRYEAARAAGELEIKAAVPRLIELIDDDDAEVREASITALGRIGGPQARQALLRCLESDNEAIQDAADSALEELEFTETGGDIPLLSWDDEDTEDETLYLDEDNED
jgi:HEAT repeat protein